MHMAKRFVFVLVALIIIVGVGITMAQEPDLQAVRNSMPSTQLLLQAEDLEPFGDVEMVTSQKRIQPSDADIPNVVSGWRQGYKVDMLVLAENGDVAMVNSAVYEFAEPTRAQKALGMIANPLHIPDYTWQRVFEDAEAVDLQSVGALNGKNWRAWQGVDDEGLPAYAIWVQDGAYVAELHVNVASGQEAFGQLLFRSLVNLIVQEKLEG